MDSINTWIKRAEAAIVATLLGAIVILVFVSAVLRMEWIGVSVAWNIDMAQLLFGWAVFLGADLAYKQDAHIGMDILAKKLPFAARRAVNLALLGAIAAFLALIAVFGFYLVFENAERLYASLQISYSYVVVSVPVGCSLMLFTTAVKIRDAIMARDGAEKQNLAAW
jgi:TRAP-type C4-dicarboxylate transport system permease small subunit